MKVKQLIVCLLSIIVSLAVYGQNLPARPTPPRLVNDFAGILTTRQIAYLEHKLSSFSDSTSNQIAIVTITDLDNTSISDYAAKLFDKWGIGSKQHNNGVLILVKPPQKASRGEVFIATGYGLEGAIPDAMAGRIVDYELIPAFKTNNYFTGLDNATETIMQLASGEYSIKSYIRNKGRRINPLFLFVLFFVLISILSSLTRRRGQRQVISSSGDRVIPPIFIGGFPFMGSHRGGGFGGFDGFSGGGGGFGGFGGGFTGGGGAGGSW
jgi:uncharacterized protein